MCYSKKSTTHFCLWCIYYYLLLSFASDLTHDNICTSSLNKLQSRIAELGVEIDDARANLKTLHKQKISIEKSLKVRNSEISEKKARVLKVQMLKFGREIDIDVLEQQSDRTWENEIEAKIVEIEESYRLKQAQLSKEQDALTDKLIEVTFTSIRLNFLF